MYIMRLPARYAIAKITLVCHEKEDRKAF